MIGLVVYFSHVQPFLFVKGVVVLPKTNWKGSLFLFKGSLSFVSIVYIVFSLGTTQNKLQTAS